MIFYCFSTWLFSSWFN